MVLRIASGLRRTLVPHSAASTSTSTRQLSTRAAEAADQLLRNFADKTSTRRQILDGNQLQKLSLTLGRRFLRPGLDVTEDAPPPGTPLPPGYHLVYFTPGGIETELGADGTDRTFNAPAPFTRRMWAGGRMKWNNDCPLRVGDAAEERTRLLSAVPKRSRDGNEMVLVDVEKQFWGDKGLALVDQRSWVFRPEVLAATEPIAEPIEGTVIRGPSTIEDESVKAAVYPDRHLRWSPVGLFRFSALTFNGHKIHYDQSWARSVEGHKGSVVHGPLNLISMLDYWRDVIGQGAIGEINYRALSPLYAGDEYRIRTSNVADAEQGKLWELLVEKDGVICMRGTIQGK